MKYHKNFLKQSKGFTLTELLAAILILSIVIIGFFSFFSQTVIFSTKNEMILASSNEVDKLAYEVKNNLDFSSGDTFLTCDTPTPLGQNQLEKIQSIENGTIELNNRFYYPKITICQDQEETKLGLLRIHIQITESQGEDDEVLSEIYDYIDLNE